MEEKASLMIASAKIGGEIEDIEGKIRELNQQLAAIPAKCQRDQVDARTAAQNAFNQRNATALEKIKKICADKKAAASELLDTFPDLGTQEFAGKYEIKDLEEHLQTIYPPSLLEDYICLNPFIFDSEQEAYQVYSLLENSIVGLRQGNMAGSLFQTLSDLLDNAADQPQIGMKVVLGVILFVAGGLILSPFLFLTVFAVLGFSSALRGMLVQKSLRQLFSIKFFLNDSYDEDIFAADKADIMEMVEDFLDSAQQEYEDVVNKREFHFDDSQLEAIKKSADLEAQRLGSLVDLQNQALEVKRQELARIIAKLDELTEQEKKYAEIARKKFIGSVEWKKEWLQQIFLEVTSENKVKVMPFAQGNSLYYSKTPEPIKQLSRLLIFQCMIHMHPNYSCNYVIDYKYNGGELTQFQAVPDRIVNMAYTEDDISKRLESINNEIRARTQNILGSCESIEQFNEMMHGYGSPGESYAVVHVFGCSSLPSQFLNNVCNGPRVGYFYKFYCTTSELIEMKDNFPLDSMQEYYEVLDNPTPRSLSVLRRLFEGAT